MKTRFIDTINALDSLLLNQLPLIGILIIFIRTLLSRRFESRDNATEKSEIRKSEQNLEFSKLLKNDPGKISNYFREI